MSLSYELSPIQEQLSQQAEAIQVLQAKVAALEQAKQVFLNTYPVRPTTVLEMTQARRERITQLLGGRDSPLWHHQALKRALYQQVKRHFRAHFDVSRYDLVPEVYHQAVLEFFPEWTPQGEVAAALYQAAQTVAARANQAVLDLDALSEEVLQHVG